MTAEEQIKQHLIESLNIWCRDLKENQNRKISHLTENTDYEIIIDIKGNKALIKCQCGLTSTLGKKDNSYIVSHVFFKKIVEYFTTVEFRSSNSVFSFLISYAFSIRLYYTKY